MDIYSFLVHIKADDIYKDISNIKVDDSYYESGRPFPKEKI